MDLFVYNINNKHTLFSKETESEREKCFFSLIRRALQLNEKFPLI